MLAAEWKARTVVVDDGPRACGLGVGQIGLTTTIIRAKVRRR